MVNSRCWLVYCNWIFPCKERVYIINVEEKFFSRRNKVYLSIVNQGEQNRKIIVKKYKSSKTAQGEFELLKHLYAKGIRVPKVIEQVGNHLTMEYLQGTLLTDVLDNSLNRPALWELWTRKLARWFSELHIKTRNSDGEVILKVDANLRNFICVKDEFYGLDFEEFIIGPPEADIGQCSAYILTNDPAFTEEKKLLVNYFVGEYCKINNLVNRERIEVEILRGLQEIAGRRDYQREDIMEKIIEYKGSFLGN